MLVHATSPSPSMTAKGSLISDPPPAQTLPRKQADGDPCLIQPTAVGGSVVHREPIPEPAAVVLTKAFHHRLAGVRTQIVQDQMDGIGFRIAIRNVQEVIGKLG